MDLHDLNVFLNSYTTLELTSRNNYYRLNSEDGLVPPLSADVRFCSDELYSEKMVDRDCSIVVHRHERFYKVDYHNHNQIEFMFQYSGHTINSVEGNTMLLNPGDICILAPGVFHLPEIYDDSILINFIIKTDTFHKIIDALPVQNVPLSNFATSLHYNHSYPKYYLQYNSNEKIRHYINELMLEYFNNEPCSDTLCENLFSAILCHMLRVSGDTVCVSPQCTSRVQPVVPILQYIHTNFQTVTLGKLSEKFNYTPQHLCRMIKAHTGQTFKKYLQSIRINRACQLLISTDFSINRIALLSGFDCVAYFHRRFKQALMLSPLAYRSSIRSQME